MNWLERRCLEHANPVNFVAHIIAVIMAIYGLWMHNWFWIIGSILVRFAGHLYVWLKKK